MVRRQNRDYGKAIAAAAISAGDDPKEPHSAGASWLDSWTSPGPMRDRSRKWLTMWLKSDLKDIPAESVMRFLTEMARDVARHGSDEAVDRFIDKILPRIISNEASKALGTNQNGEA